jgi:hypothetical protein
MEVLGGGEAQVVADPKKHLIGPTREVRYLKAWDSGWRPGSDLSDGEVGQGRHHRRVRLNKLYFLLILFIIINHTTNAYQVNFRQSISTFP